MSDFRTRLERIIATADLDTRATLYEALMTETTPLAAPDVAYLMTDRDLRSTELPLIIGVIGSLSAAERIPRAAAVTCIQSYLRHDVHHWIQRAALHSAWKARMTELLPEIQARAATAPALAVRELAGHVARLLGEGP